jgi:1,5-anhydro-D-fructose reductase (1,5-anhydro-D-mannitol-forming)
MEHVAWGIMGSTAWADMMFGPAIQGASNARLHAVLSSNQANADAFCAKHSVECGYSNLEAFLADDEVEAIWIATPQNLHAEQTIAALEHGKHVLCEKTMAVTAAECESMILAAERTGNLLSIGYHMRHHPLHRELQQDWNEGQFGTPIYARAQIYFPYGEAPTTWRAKKETSGGWAINDVGTHGIDLLRWFLGDASAVHGELSNLRFGLETDDHAVVTIRFRNGAVGVADASTAVGAPAPRLELYGSEGYCILDGTLFGGGGTVTQSRAGADADVSEAPMAPLYQNQAEAFSRAVRGEEELIVTAEDGLDNVKIIEQARGW